MIILIGNQKGGAGKSTFTLLLANYLSMLKQIEVLVLDLDYQASVSVKADKYLALQQKLPYEVIHKDLASFPSMLPSLKRHAEAFILIDLPGKMDDDALIPVILSGDLIICPFNYDEFSVDSSLIFAMVCAKINNSADTIFLPNRVKSTVRYETKEEVDKALRSLGKVYPPIADRIDFQRVGIGNTPGILLPIVEPILDKLFREYLARRS